MSILDCVVGCSVIGFYVPSMLCYGLIRVCVLYPFYTVLWVGQCLCSMSLLNCNVVWLVFG